MGRPAFGKPERPDGSTFEPLTCVECAALADEAASRWRAYLSADEEVVIFCPACAEHEFGISPEAREREDER